jgi:hypothetical protein
MSEDQSIEGFGSKTQRSIQGVYSKGLSGYHVE